MRGGLAAALVAGLAALAAVGPVPQAMADVPGVSGESVVFGNVTFIRDGANLYIQASDGSIINYASFNIAAGELVQFLQPGSNARVLNRILGVGPSEIDGQLLANGIVYIVNPAGVIFGADSVVDVGGIYASAANITNGDFLAGIDQFTGAAGDVVNHGSIQAARVHLLGQIVRNHGDISAPGGVVTMLAGDSFLLGEVGGQLLVHVDGSDVANEPAGTSGVDPSITTDAGVLNAGTVNVGGGHAFLAAGDLYSLGVHNVGQIQAGGGRVTMASGDGVVYNEGTVDVSDASQAGSVLMRAPTVINGGLVTAASSDGQAGTIEMLGHDHVYLFNGSTTDAGGGSGLAEGGVILMIAQDGLMFVSQGAFVDASGGAVGGNGGFIETSGAQLVLEGQFDLAAAPGWNPGLMFIDPFDIVIGNNGADDPLLDGDSITFNEGNPIGQTLISVAALQAITGNILLQANNDIFLNVQLDLSGFGNAIAFEALRDVVFNSNIIGATGLDVTAGRNILFQGTGAGQIDFDVAGAINLDALSIFVNGSITGDSIAITLGGGTLDFDATGNTDQALVADTGSLSITGGSITKSTNGDLALTGATGVTVGGDASTTNGSLTITGDLTLGGDLDSAADLTLDGNVVLNGAGAQELTAADTLSATGSLTKATGDLTLTGTDIDLDDDVTATAGTLELDGAATVAGDLTAGTDLVLGSTVSFDGAGAQSATAGGTLDAAAGLTKATGDLTLGGTDIELATDVSATLGALTLDGNVVFEAAGAQSASAGTTLSITGTATKATGDLTLTGTAIDLDGDVTATAGGLELDGAATVAGDLTAGTSVVLGDAVSFDGAGAQGVTAGTTIDAAGDLTKAAGDLTLAATDIELAGDVAATLGALTLDGDVAFDAAGAQSATAGTALSITGTATKATGDLTLGGTTLDLDGDVDATAAALQLDGAATVAGNLSAGTSVTVDGVVFDAAGAQTITAGTTLTASGDLTKATGDLTLTGTTLDLDGDAEATAGQLELDGTGTAAGDLTAGTDLVLAGDLSLDGAGAQTLTAGGTLSSPGTLTKATGDLTLVGTAIDLDDDVTATAGGLELDGAATVAGDLTAGTDLVLGAAVTLDGAGLQTLTAGDTLSAAGTLTKATGDLTLVGSDLELDDDVSAVAAALILQGDGTLLGDLVAGTDLTLDGAMSFGAAGAQSVTAGGTLAATGTLTKAAGDLTLAGATLDLDDDVAATAGQLELDGGGTVAGDLSAGTDLVLNDALTLDGAGLQTLTAGDTLTASGTLSKAAGDLTLVGTDIDLDADVEATAGGLELDGAATVAGDLTAGTFLTLDAVTFDAAGAQAATAGTTLAASGDLAKAAGNLTLTATTFDLDGSAEATAGQLELDGAGTVAGDLTAGGDLTLTTSLTLDGAGSQQISSGGVLDIAGGLVKSAGDLVLIGDTSIDIGGTVVVPGTLTASGGDWNQTAAVGATTIDVGMDGAVTVDGNLFAVDTLRVRSGLDGTGDLSVGAVGLQGAMIILEAGDGAGGGSAAQLIFDPAATLGGSGGAVQADAIVLRQDAALAVSNLPGAAQFVGGTAGLDLTLESREGAVTLDAAGPLAGTQLTVASAADVTATVALALQSLDLTTAGTATFQQSLAVTGDADVTGDLALQDTLSAANLDVSGDLELGGNGAWTYTIAGDASVGGTLSFAGTGTRQFDAGGDLTLAAADLDGASAGGLSAGGDLTVTGAVTGTGSGGRTLSAGGTLALDGSVQLDAGDVVLVGTLIDLGALIDVDGSLTFDGLTQAAGNITAGDTIAFMADVVLDATGVQVLTAGTLIMADGSVTKVQGDLELLAPQVTVAGTLAAGDDLTLSGDLDGAAVTVGNSLRLTSGTGQAITATTLDVDRDLLATGSGDITIDTTGGTTVGGALSVADGGLAVTGTLDVTGNLGVSEDLSVQDAATVGGGVTAGGTIAFADTVNVGGDLAGGSTIDFGDAATIGGDVTAGTDITFNGATMLGGDLTAGGDATFLSTLGLTAAGLQSLDAGGILQLDGAVTKASGNLSLDAGTLTRVGAAVTVGDGLIFGGPTELDLGGGQVQAGTSIVFAGPLTLPSDVVLLSTGDGQIIAVGTVTGPGGIRIDTAGDTRFDAAVNVGWIEAVGGGRTLLSGNVTTAAHQLWGDEVQVLGPVVFRSTGDDVIRFEDELTGGSAVEIRTAGDTFLEGRVDVGSLLTSGGGLTWLLADRITTDGSLRILDGLRLSQDTLLRSTGGGQVRLGGGVIGLGDLLRIETSGQTRLEGQVRVGRLETDAAGSLAFGADILATDGLDLRESSATLIGDTILRDTSGDTLILAFSVDGGHALEVDASGDLDLRGEIGASSRLASFTARTPGLLVLRMDAIRTIGDIRLNPAGRSDVPTAATIVAPDGSIRFDSTSGNFLMGIREKLTVLGTLDLVLAGAGSTATLSDITTLGDMNITASQILLQLREAGFLLDQFGFVSNEPDFGLDFVTGGRFRFSVAPTTLGSGALPSFASPDGLGDAQGTLGGFLNQSFGAPITVDDLVSLVDGTILDLKADGPTNANVSEAFASLIPRDSEIRAVPLETALAVADIERLQEFSIFAERPDAEEYVRNTEAGSAFYSDASARSADRPEVTVNRLLNDRVRDVLARYDRLLAAELEAGADADPALAGGPGDGSEPGGQADAAAVEVAAADRRDVMRDRLLESILDYQEANPEDGGVDADQFLAHLEASGNLEMIRFLADMGDVLEGIELLGLTRREVGLTRQYLMGQILPVGLGIERLEAMIEAAGTRPRP